MSKDFSQSTIALNDNQQKPNSDLQSPNDNPQLIELNKEDTALINETNHHLPNTQDQTSNEKEKHTKPIDKHFYSQDSNSKEFPQSIYKGELPTLPYNGKSPYLISKIFIIGFNTVNIKKLILKNANKVQQQEGQEHITIGYPEVLKVFTSENPHSLNNETLISFIFPTEPKIYITKGSKTFSFKAKSVVFSFNIPLSRNDKSSDNYYAYVHTETITLLDQIYYYPKVICYLSNYPFFLNYYVLSRYYFSGAPSPSSSKKAKAKEMNDMWFYHLVNLPSPINAPYQLNYFPSAGAKLGPNRPMIFNQLSGYPLFQFNFAELFSILPARLITQIFLFAFLEQDIIFFSENIEVLNIAMYIFANLNYPLNDSPYFFQVVSHSLETLKEGNSAYLTKTFTSMMGIKASYGEELNQYITFKDYFVVDLENKVILFKTKRCFDISEETAKILKLKDYFDQLTAEDSKPSVVPNSLSEAIADLNDEMNLIGHMITHRNSKDKTGFNQPIFFEADQRYDIDMNKSIQEKFYYFIVKVLSYFSTMFHLVFPTENKSKFSISYSKDKVSTVKNDREAAEALFYREFLESSKYNTYIASFIQENDCLDLFKIPLLFTEEFVNQYICDKVKSKADNGLFDTIDKLYNKQKDVCIQLHLDFFYNWTKILASKSNMSQYPNKNNINYDLSKYVHYELNKCKRKNKDIQLIYKYMNYFKQKSEIAKEAFSFNVNYTSIQFISVAINESSSSPKLKSKTELMPMHRSNSHQISIARDKGFLNQIINAYLSEIQQKVEDKILKENKLSRNEMIFISYILLYIIARKHYAYSLNKLNMIINLLITKKASYSVRKLVTMLIILNIRIIKQRKAKGEGYADEMQGLASLIVSLKELECIPNEELMLCLNDSVQNSIITLNDLAIASDRPSAKGEEVSANKITHQCRLKFNAGRNGLYREEYFLRLAENTQCVRNLFIEETDNAEENDKLKMPPKQIVRKYTNVRWIVQHKKKIYATPLFSPLKLYNLLTEKTEEIEGDFDKDSVRLDAEMMNSLCCNLIFYMLNIKDICQEPVPSTTKDIEKKSPVANEYLEFLYDVIELINSSTPG